MWILSPPVNGAPRSREDFRTLLSARDKRLKQLGILLGGSCIVLAVVMKVADFQIMADEGLQFRIWPGVTVAAVGPSLVILSSVIWMSRPHSSLVGRFAHGAGGLIVGALLPPLYVGSCCGIMAGLVALVTWPVSLVSSKPLIEWGFVLFFACVFGAIGALFSPYYAISSCRAAANGRSPFIHLPRAVVNK